MPAPLSLRFSTSNKSLIALLATIFFLATIFGLLGIYFFIHGPSWIYGPSWDEYFVGSSAASSDGKAVFFTYDHVRVWRRQIGSYSWGKQDPKQRGIGVFELQSKKIRVVNRRFHYRLEEICWNKMLLATSSRQTNADGSITDREEHHLLDTVTGQSTPLPMSKELQTLNRRGPSFPHLVDGKGTIVFSAWENIAKGDKLGPTETWIRWPSGRYFFLAVGARVLALGNGQLLISDGAMMRNFLYNIEKESHREISPQEAHDLQSGAPWHSSPDGKRGWCAGADHDLIRLEVVQTRPGSGGSATTFRMLRRTAKKTEVTEAILDNAELAKVAYD